MTGIHGVNPDSLILTEDCDGVAVIWLNRPEQRNSLRVHALIAQRVDVRLAHDRGALALRQRCVCLQAVPHTSGARPHPGQRRALPGAGACCAATERFTRWRGCHEEANTSSSDRPPRSKTIAVSPVITSSPCSF